MVFWETRCGVTWWTARSGVPLRATSADAVRTVRLLAVDAASTPRTAAAEEPVTPRELVPASFRLSGQAVDVDRYETALWELLEDSLIPGKSRDLLRLL
ncbi:hypothetical protein [Streptomyces sp. GESEQ-4]|uniref:hypothetical protein n=1 Tax=Streptomyces sp. GESEQ-4 TaxID=2812655 RepID=UPI001B326711|nr:hypothetical protein [Streptomyces sp. GESEQ-4]